MTPLDAGLAGVDQYISANSSYPEAKTIRAKVRAMLRAYDSFWGESNRNDYEVLGVEKQLLGPIKSLLNDKDSGYLAGGKLDVRLRERTGRKHLLIMDHKFLAGEMDDQDIEHLLIDGQPNQYGYLELVNGVRIDSALWDVICKTAHRPRKESSCIVKAAKPERTLSRAWTDKETGIKHPKGTVLPASPEVRDVTPAETIEEFEERVLAIYLANPAKYFARPRVPIMSHTMADHVQELYAWTKELDMCKKTGKHLRNTDYCFDHMKPCKYLGICSGRSNIGDGTWMKRHSPHAELELPAGVDPHLVITNSRIKVFKGCRLKHDLQYNQSLIKINEQPEEPLYIGSCSHVGLEHYWKTIAASQGKSL